MKGRVHCSNLVMIRLNQYIHVESLSAHIKQRSSFNNICLPLYFYGIALDNNGWVYCNIEVGNNRKVEQTTDVDDELLDRGVRGSGA